MSAALATSSLLLVLNLSVRLSTSGSIVLVSEGVLSISPNTPTDLVGSAGVSSSRFLDAPISGLAAN